MKGEADVLGDSILTLSGIGPKKAELFQKLGVTTLGELLRLYPRAYEDRTKLVPIAALEADIPACFLATVATNPQTHRIPKPGNRRMEITKVTVADHTGRLHLTFFNAAYTADRLLRGETYCFYGSVTGDYLGYAMINPVFEPLESAGRVTRCIVPIYPLTAGLTNKAVQQAVQAALGRMELPELLPPEIARQYGLCSGAAALRQIHMPTDAAALEQARKRLVFEEFYRFSIALQILRARLIVCTSGFYFTKGPVALRRLRSALLLPYPFRL